MTNNVSPSLPDPWQGWFDVNAWKLMAFARQMVTAVADAEDVVQEVIVEFWRRQPEKIPDVPIVLFKIRQRAIDLGRRKQSQRRRETRWLQEQSCSATLNLNPMNSRSHDIQRIISQLEPMFREVVVLRLWNGLTNQQIGDVIGVSPSTVASRYRLALQKLRSLLEEMPYE